MRPSFLALLWALIALSSCAPSHSIVVVGDHTTEKELRKAQFFQWSKQTHVLKVGYVGGNETSLPQEAIYLTQMLDFDPASADQHYRPHYVEIGGLRFAGQKGNFVPEPTSSGWMDTTFQNTRSVRLLNEEEHPVSAISIYLPLPLTVNYSENDTAFTLDWIPDSLNPNGLSIWFNAVRGPNTGHRGKLQGFNRTYSVDDRCGRVSLPKAALPSWIWEDPDHTSLSMTVFRRVIAKGDIEGKKQDLRVVATQGMKYEILVPEWPGATH